MSLPSSASLPVPADSSSLPSELRPRDRWFAEEVHPHDGELRAFLRNAYPSVRDVDDIVQESYLRIWKAAAREPIQSARSFLYLVARRVALNLLRKHRNSPLESFEEREALQVVEARPDAGEAAVLQERLDLLANALMSLPVRCRDVVVLHKVKGLTQREVAEQLGISERTVETHVRTGVARCNAYLRKHGFSNYRGDEI